MSTKTKLKKSKLTKNSFFAKLGRARSAKSVNALAEVIKEGCENPKTLRRRRRAMEEKLAKLAA